MICAQIKQTKWAGLRIIKSHVIVIMIALIAYHLVRWVWLEVLLLYQLRYGMEVEESAPLLESKRPAVLVKGSRRSNILRKVGVQAKGVLGLQTSVSGDEKVKHS